jgi:hypothetical protein
LATDLELNEADTIEMESYITVLKTIQVRLRDQEDELVWERIASGIYTPKEGYNFLIQEQVHAKSIW